jgi:spore coat polysaccharide biosynthesis protein SpsF (cytidylyltransferase family)
MTARTVVIVQARMGSTRLPGKVMAEIAGRPMLWHVLDRSARIVGAEAVMLATTALPEDERLLALAREWDVPVYAGSPEDVLDRFYQAARLMDAHIIVRVTADCPLLDPAVGSAVLAQFLDGDAAYASNVHPPTYPDGLDVEVFSREALECAWREATRSSEREHVTPYFWTHPERFLATNLTYHQDLSHLRWTVDEPRDLEFVRAVYDRLSVPGRPPFGMDAVLDLLAHEPGLLRLNAGIVRDVGYLKSLAAEATAGE